MIDEYCRRQQLLNKLKPVNEGVMKTFNIELSLAVLVILGILPYYKP